MVRRGASAAMGGAQTEPGGKECASRMERRGKVAATRGALIKPPRAEFASRMVERANVAATRGAQIYQGRSLLLAWSEAKEAHLQPQGVHQI
jgi:hypothetical protein